MKLFRILALALACSLGASSVMAGNAGGGKGLPGGASGSTPAPVAVWMVMGCASSIIFAAFLASRTQKRELSGREATTCGLSYWLRPRPR